jgi:hypothetical protein
MALSKVDPNFLNVSQVGGRRNLIINGDHQIQQRGTSFPTSGADQFASDRWALNPIGASPCSGSIQFDSTLQKNTLKVTKETSTGDIQIVNKIEGFKQFHNKQFTLSYYVRASTSRDLYIGSGFSSASGFTSIETTTVPATPSWQRFTRTFSSTDMSSYTENSSSWLRIEFRLSGTSGGSVAAGEWIEFTDVQIELGNTATPFEHRSYGEELSLCQRYFQIAPVPQDYSDGISNSNIYRSYTIATEMRSDGTAAIVDQISYFQGGSGVNITPTVNAYKRHFRIAATGLSTARGFVGGTISLDSEL